MSRTTGRVLTSVGLLLAVAGIAGAATSLVSLLWLRSETVGTTYAASGAVRVDSSCGDVDVRAADVATIEVSTHVWWSFGKPTVSSMLDGATRVVTVRCAAWSFGTGNSADVTLTVPQDSAVSVRASAGHVRLDAVGGDVSVEASAGRVDGVDLRATHVTASSSADAVRLAFATPPTDVDARSSAGSVAVLVPDDGSAYAVTATTSAGHTDVTIATDPRSARRLVAKSSAGDVRVGYAD